MYLNFFARQWCVNEFKTLFSEISIDYDIYVLTLQHDKIHNPTFHERFITHIIIESGNDRMSVDICGKICVRSYWAFCKLFDEFKKSHKITKADTSIQKAITTEVETTLGIDNNVNQEKNKKITFCLNDYTSTSRDNIIAFLASVDSNSPEVYIDIDLSSCSKEQAEYLSNILVCATSLTRTQ